MEVRTSENYQKGDNLSRQADMDQCQVGALAKAPRAPNSSDVDLNFDLRMRMFDACMTEKGYAVK